MEIVDAAARLFEKKGLAGTSLSAIARATCISKAALYRYFESREAIFLELLTEDYEEWIGDLEVQLAPLAGSDDHEAVSEVLVHTLAARPRLATLMRPPPTSWSAISPSRRLPSSRRRGCSMRSAWPTRSPCRYPRSASSKPASC